MRSPKWDEIYVLYTDSSHYSAFICCISFYHLFIHEFYFDHGLISVRTLLKTKNRPTVLSYSEAVKRLVTMTTMLRTEFET